jgi:shikimate kinase
VSDRDRDTVAQILPVAPLTLPRGNLFLVGLPGAGKSTLGRQIARRLHKRFVDADVELEHRLGVSIPTVFEIEGESGFRDREEATIADLTQLSDIVLATGGGAVLRENNRVLLTANGTVLYLHASPVTLWERVRHSRNRPLLQTDDPLGRLHELYTFRDPLYRAVANHVVESNRDEVMRFARAFDPESSRADYPNSTPD